MQLAAQMRHCLPHRRDCKIRQAAFDLRRLAVAQFSPSAARRRIAAAACKESLMLQLFLKRHTGQHILTAKIGSPHITEQRTVCSAAGAVMITHPVGHHTACLRRCHDNLAARTHAEGIDPATIFTAPAQLIVCGRQPQLPSGCAVLRNIDQILWVLNTHAYRKRFLRHGDPARVHPAKRITRAVSHGKNNRLARHAGRGHGRRRAKPVCSLAGLTALTDILRAVPLYILYLISLFVPHRVTAFSCISNFFADHTTDTPVVYAQILHQRMKPHLPAEAFDLFADILDHDTQNIGADVRLLLVQDLLRCAGSHEFLQHLANTHVLDACGQFAVTEGARAAFSKLYIGLHVQHTILPETLYCGCSGIHILPALQHQRSQSRLRQNQRCKHACRSETDNDWTILQNTRAYCLRFLRRLWLCFLR